MSNKLTEKQIEKTIKLVNEWFDKRNYLDEPDFILHKWLNGTNYHVDGHPIFKADFDWSRTPTPTFIWEGCSIPDWVDEVAYELNPILNKQGIFLEPYASWALSIYRWDN